MVVHSILHPSTEEKSMPYLARDPGAWKDNADPLLDDLTKKLAKGATIRDFAEVDEANVRGEMRRPISGLRKSAKKLGKNLQCHFMLEDLLLRRPHPSSLQFRRWNDGSCSGSTRWANRLSPDCLHG